MPVIPHSVWGIQPYSCATWIYNSVSYLQSSMESMFGHLPANIWLDHILGYAADTYSLQDTLKLRLQVCHNHGLKLHPSKCELVTGTAKFCGRIIDSKGVRFKPSDYNALTNMQPPTTVRALMNLVNGANWMHSAITQFTQLIDPLHTLLETHYHACNTWKKSRLQNRPLSEWGARHQESFTSLICSIVQQVTLSTTDPAKRLCLSQMPHHPTGLVFPLKLTQTRSGRAPRHSEIGIILQSHLHLEHSEVRQFDGPPPRKSASSLSQASCDSHTSLQFVVSSLCSLLTKISCTCCPQNGLAPIAPVIYITKNNGGLYVWWNSTSQWSKSWGTKIFGRIY